ncbi:hypothetical protein C2E15_03745 [Mixta gaviniae]|uniref:Uncharacterized protein n=1 Tax=Mixta gaviniae TaxID=665914 RepID=A0A1X1DIT5_9GAMM|nr:hypothetical protein C2E15_03745 [Mixta gaviniae]ORM76460.1 hypothetical protein HA44_15445 [Mixta gaviniae]
MTDAEGELRWEGQNSAWGKLLRETALQGTGFAQNLRMQGQYLDRDKSAGSRFEQRVSLAPKGRASWMRRVFRPALQSVSLLRPGQRTFYPAGSDRAGGRDKSVSVCAECAGVD